VLATLIFSGFWGECLSGIIVGVTLGLLGLIAKRTRDWYIESAERDKERDLQTLKAQHDRDAILATQEEFREALVGERPTPFRPHPPPGLIRRVEMLEEVPAGIKERQERIEQQITDLAASLENGLRSDVRAVLEEQERVRAELMSLRQATMGAT
jgi:hypothetical protein